MIASDPIKSLLKRLAGREPSTYDPTMVLERALTHAGLSRPYEVCRAALQESWSERDALRFNRGE
ncbi:MAG: hypothetical protein WCB49_01060, partial [Gammaproteobacteria bacterium]